MQDTALPVLHVPYSRNSGSTRDTDGATPAAYVVHIWSRDPPNLEEILQIRKQRNRRSPPCGWVQRYRGSRISLLQTQLFAVILSKTCKMVAWRSRAPPRSPSERTSLGPEFSVVVISWDVEKV